MTKATLLTILILFTCGISKAQQIYVPEELCCSKYWELQRLIPQLDAEYQKKVDNLSNQINLLEKKIDIYETLFRSDSVLRIEAQKAVLDQVAATRIQIDRATNAENRAKALQTELDRVKGRGILGKVWKGAKIAIPAFVAGAAVAIIKF